MLSENKMAIHHHVSGQHEVNDLKLALIIPLSVYLIGYAIFRLMAVPSLVFFLVTGMNSFLGTLPEEKQFALANVILVVLVDIASLMVLIILVHFYFKKKHLLYASYNTENSVFSLDKSIGMSIRFWIYAFVLVYVSNIILLLLYFSVFKKLPSVNTVYQEIFLQSFNWWEIAFIFFAVAIVAPIFEEYFFRRILVPILYTYIPNIHFTAIFNGILFAFVHMPTDVKYAIEAGSPYTIVIRFLSTALIGYFLALLFLKTNDIRACIVFHGVNNAVALIASFGFTTSLFLIFITVFLLTIYFVIRNYRAYIENVRSFFSSLRTGRTYWLVIAVTSVIITVFIILIPLLLEQITQSLTIPIIPESMRTFAIDGAYNLLLGIFAFIILRFSLKASNNTIHP